MKNYETNVFLRNLEIYNLYKTCHLLIDVVVVVFLFKFWNIKSLRLEVYYDII
jgi:hypothetical protein